MYISCVVTVYHAMMSAPCVCVSQCVDSLMGFLNILFKTIIQEKIGKIKNY
jgi:hypothetical protein